MKTLSSRSLQIVAGLALALSDPALAHANGTINFGNNSSNRVVNGHTGQPVSSASSVKAALYWAPIGSDSFVQLGASVPVGAPAAGLFLGGTRTTGAATFGGANARFRIRAWSGGHATYEQAILQPGVLIGESLIITNATGDPMATPPLPPPSLLSGGLTGFSIVSNNPAGNPLVVTCPSNVTVQCGAAWTFGTPTTTGGCATVTITVLNTVTNGACPTLITRAWQVTDGCTTNTCGQIVSIVDTTPPAITCASNKTVECGAPWSFDAPTATDVCGMGSVTAISTITNAGCGNTYIATRTWLAADLCGNTNTCSQVVSVVDTTPPLIVCASNAVVACGQPWAFAAPTASDACGTNAISIFSTTTNFTCGSGAFAAIRTWLASDGCGNVSQCTQTVTVVDLVAPVFNCVSNKTVTCQSVWSFDEPTAADACGGTNVTLTVTLTQTNSTSPFVVTRTWEARDSCSNSAYCSQTVTVLPNCPPLLTCESNKILFCTNAWSFDTPSGADSCGGTNISVSVLGTVTNTLCPLSITRTWHGTNACNPAGVTCSQTVTVLCPNCPVLVLTKSCPAHPVPPGGTLAWTGTITNGSEIVVSNVMVLNNQPASNTLVLGPVTLLPGAGVSFAGSYPVSISTGPHADTLTASGTGLEGILFTSSATASCAGTNHITPGDVNGDGVVDQAELNVVLANYWPHSPWLYMTNATLLGNGRFQFELTNAGAWNFTVLVSTNATDWSPLPPPVFPVYQFVDPSTNEPQRLYRLQWP